MVAAMAEAADAYTDDIMARMAQFFRPSVQWHRALWDTGLVLGLQELFEGAGAVADGALSAKAIKEQGLVIRNRLANDPGAGLDEQRSALKQLLMREFVAGGTNHRELAIWTADIERHYLHRWEAKVGEPDKPSREETARALASHLLDAGLSADRLAGWLRDMRSKGSDLDAPGLVREAEALLSEGLQGFEALILFLQPPAEDLEKPPEWLNARDAKGWLADNGFGPRRQHGALLIKVQARDVHAASALFAETVDRLRARAIVGTRRPVELDEEITIAGEAHPTKLTRFPRAEVHALEREGQLIAVDQRGPIDAALELLSHINSAAPPVAVAGGWSAVESLLSGPGDEDKWVTAERLAYLVACSWPRAELTTLAWARVRQVKAEPDAIAAELLAFETNRERAERMLRAIVDEEDLELQKAGEQLALRRMEKLVKAPRASLLAVQLHASVSLRRLYRQRNLVLHGGRTVGVALKASIRTAAPLIGAGLDRVTHASLVNDTHPLDLAARARVEVDRAGLTDAPALTGLLE